MTEMGCSVCHLSLICCSEVIDLLCMLSLLVPLWSQLTIVVSTKAFSKNIWRMITRWKTRDPKNDGLFNQLFPADAPNDPQTIRQAFNLLKQVMPNGDNMERLCMIGYTRANYGNLYSLFHLMVANLSDKETEYIIDKETTGKLNAKSWNSQQYLKNALDDISGEVFTYLYFNYLH